MLIFCDVIHACFPGMKTFSHYVCFNNFLIMLFNNFDLPIFDESFKVFMTKCLSSELYILYSYHLNIFEKPTFNEMKFSALPKQFSAFNAKL